MEGSRSVKLRRAHVGATATIHSKSGVAIVESPGQLQPAFKEALDAQHVLISSITFNFFPSSSLHHRIPAVSSYPSPAPFQSYYCLSRSFLTSHFAHSPTSIHPLQPFKMVSVKSLLLTTLFTLASAQSSDASMEAVSLPPNPATQYLTQTDSAGVVTGMPAVETSQPSNPDAITEQPALATLPALPDGETTLTFNNRTYTVNVSGDKTSIVSPTPTPSSSGDDSNGDGSDSGSDSDGSSSASEGAAAVATGKMAAGALVAAAGVFAALL